jgi:uncharacterized protein HemY
MMTLSVSKILLIVVLIVAVWYVSRLLNRGAPTPERRRRREAARPRSREAIEDLVPCRVCGAYVSPGAHHCGRPACPQAR